MNKYINIVVILALMQIGSVKNISINKILIFERSKSLWIYDIREIKMEELIKNAYNPACSSNGKMIAFTRNYDVWVFFIKDKKEVKLTGFEPQNSMEIRNLSWSPKQDYIAFERKEKFTIKSKEAHNPIVWPEGEYQKQESQIDLSCIWIVNTQISSKTVPRKLLIRT